MSQELYALEQSTHNTINADVSIKDDKSSLVINAEPIPESGLPGEYDLQKALTSRHIQMIAIGGAIGSGLFIGSGASLALGGPANLILGFITMGVAIYFMMQALGELAVLYPVKGSLGVYATKFIHPAWGFAMTWNYILQWWATLPLELSAAALTLLYWGPDLNVLGFIALFYVFIIIVNVAFGTIGYGECEFFFSMLKATAVVIFILMGIIVNVGGGPNGTFYGVKTWSDPGAFYNGFHGYCAIFVNASFAYAGTELVGLAVAETDKPHIVMPMATKQVVWRLLIFYVVSLLVVGFIVPYTDPNLLGGGGANTSPFVIAADMAGISGMADFMNAIILISTLSVGNAAVYGGSRAILALVEAGQAPKIMGYVDKGGRPLVALAMTLPFGLIAFVSHNAETAATCFTWLLAISGLAALFTWGSILVAHIRFRAAWVHHGRSVEEIPFQAQFGVYGSYLGLTIVIGALAATFYTALFPADYYPATDDYIHTITLSVYYFFSLYLAAPVVFFFFVSYIIYSKIRYPEVKMGWKGLGDIDILTDLSVTLPTLKELQATRAEEAKKPFYIRWYNALFY